MTTPVGQGQPPVANGSLSPPANPSSFFSLKRPRSEPTTPDTDLAPSSTRQKTTAWVVLDENCGDFRLIPDEVVYRIFSHLNASTLVRAGISCRRFLPIADRVPMWRELCLDAKLSIKEGDSFRLAFLSAIAKENPDAYIAKAYFFSMGAYTKENQSHVLGCYRRALSCLDHAINMDPVWEQNALSERQIEIVFKKEALFLTNQEFLRSWFAPGQIQTTYDQLDYIVSCPHKDKAARASLLYTIMMMSDRDFPTLSISSVWDQLNTIRLDEQADDQVRKTAKYMLSFFSLIKPTTRWEQADFAQFIQSQRDLSHAERAKILKECIADPTALPWCNQVAKMSLVYMRLHNHSTEEITDKEAYGILESLKNAPHLFSSIDQELIEERMQAFRDQKRV